MIELIVGVLILMIALAIVWYAGGALGLPQPVVLIILLVMLLLGIIILAGNVDLNDDEVSALYDRV